MNSKYSLYISDSVHEDWDLTQFRTLLVALEGYYSLNLHRHTLYKEEGDDFKISKMKQILLYLFVCLKREKRKQEINKFVKHRNIYRVSEA